MTNLDILKKLAEAATPVLPSDLMQYDHGGGRLAVIRDGKRDLVADFYDEANRDYYAAMSPNVCLELLARIEELEKHQTEHSLAEARMRR